MKSTQSRLECNDLLAAAPSPEREAEIDKYAEPFRCPTHRELLVKRPLGQQTQEQLSCGTWFDCQRCHYSVLVQSDELMAFLEEQRAQYEAAKAQGELPFKAPKKRKQKAA